MNLFERLKADLLHARRGGPELAATAGSLRVLVGEAEGLQKSARRQRTGPLDDAEMLALIQKSVVGLDEAISQAQSLGRDTTAARAERTLLGAYLPAVLTPAELDQVIQEVLRGQPDARLGDVMRELQARHRGQFDGTTARLRIQELLSARAGVAAAGVTPDV
ncbi:GatB/YqeY domain-containing protein (plasmid) [Deinococcus sp. KNUC1210]|uniref:GatB/YqeY domain-containing protein n=1 Tax=Deinococcus sp. KNUC1210 TaxID=2917691 RepID=UPI001EF04ADA|nr:GatB/YqeY domain-containing protein [Deinococcus sp. KNUC1210]ULH17632.1 GatB/YqeY domain-containing protein [Deinococcus sp. KNUC1210]